MKYNELKISAAKPRRRVGRGISAGQGKTAGRGTKGQNARTGKTAKPGFAGGQNPLMQALPKLRGFKPFWEPKVTISTDQLLAAGLKGKVDTHALYKAHLLNNPYRIVRLVAGKKQLKNKLEIELQAGSEKAVSIVEKAGGSFKKVDRLSRPAKKTEK